MKLARLLIAAISFTLLNCSIGSAQESNKITLGTGTVLPSALIEFALKQDLFKKAGLDVHAIKFASGQRGLEALLGGQLDLTFVAEYPPLIAAMHHQPFGIVTTISTYTAFRFIGRSDKGFKTIRDLVGKKVGTTRATNAGYFAETELTQAGVKAEVVNVGPSEIVPALARGDIDAGVMFPTFYHKAKVVLGDKYREQIFKDYRSYYFIAATKKMIEQRPDVLKKFLAVLVEARDMVAKDPSGAKAAVVDASRGVLNAAAVDRDWPDYNFDIGFDDRVLKTLMSEAEWTKAQNIIPNAQADKTMIRAMIADGPIRSLAPKSDALPH
jgi:NitT/TauT family transport system substrate-binding protein